MFEVKRPHIRRKLGRLDFQQDQRVSHEPTTPGDFTMVTVGLSVHLATCVSALSACTYSKVPGRQQLCSKHVFV